jgi:hypothetical protein
MDISFGVRHHITSRHITSLLHGEARVVLV